MAVGGPISTYVSIHNTGGVGNTVLIEFFGSDGLLKREESVQVAAGGVKTAELSFPGEEIEIGWARLSSTATTFDASELFQIHSAGGTLLTQVGVLPSYPISHFKLER